MRRRVAFALSALLSVFWAAAPVFGAALHPEIELSKFDDELMRELDRTIKYFEPDVMAGNVDNASDDAATIQDGLKWLEDYFVNKGASAQHAVEIARASQQSLAAAMTSLKAHDLQAAGASARQVSQACRSCHEEYRPEKAR